MQYENPHAHLLHHAAMALESFDNAGRASGSYTERSNAQRGLANVAQRMLDQYTPELRQPLQLILGCISSDPRHGEEAARIATAAAERDPGMIVYASHLNGRLLTRHASAREQDVRPLIRNAVALGSRALYALQTRDRGEAVRALHTGLLDVASQSADHYAITNALEAAYRMTPTYADLRAATNAETSKILNRLDQVDSSTCTSRDAQLALRMLEASPNFPAPLQEQAWHTAGHVALHENARPHLANCQKNISFHLAHTAALMARGRDQEFEKRMQQHCLSVLERDREKAPFGTLNHLSGAVSYCIDKEQSALGWVAEASVKYADDMLSQPDKLTRHHLLVLRDLTGKLMRLPRIGPSTAFTLPEGNDLPLAEAAGYLMLRSARVSLQGGEYHDSRAATQTVLERATTSRLLHAAGSDLLMNLEQNNEVLPPEELRSVFVRLAKSPTHRQTAINGLFSLADQQSRAALAGTPPTEVLSRLGLAMDVMCDVLSLAPIGSPDNKRARKGLGWMQSGNPNENPFIENLTPQGFVARYSSGHRPPEAA